MTIDKAKLKDLAQAVAELEDIPERQDEHAEAVAYLETHMHCHTILALLAEIDRLTTSRSKKERELEQELEVWHHGPFCWTCGDTGDVHDITGEWRGECDCLSSQVINANRERDQLKAENEALRKIISESSAACGAAVSVECSLEFMANLPSEIGAVLTALRKDAERYRFVRKTWCPDLPSEKADAQIDTAMAKEASHG